jgi:hypothetical protein
MGRTIGARLFDQSDIVTRLVDPDQHLDSAGQILPKDGPQGVRDCRAHDRWHDDGHVGRTLRLKTPIRERSETRLERSGHSHHHCPMVRTNIAGGVLACMKSDPGAVDLQPAGLSRLRWWPHLPQASSSRPSLDHQVERFLSSLIGVIEEATLQRGRIPSNSLTSGKAVENHA